MDISVIVCTHNPNLRYLERTLGALREQTLDTEKWELLLVDNRSADPLAQHFDLAWQPHARHVREETIGLTWARIRGIDEARGRTIIFVDDDNILAPSYLQTALSLQAKFPQLTAIGAGVIVPEYEEEPTAELLPYLNMLALRQEDRPHWGNSLSYNSSVPFGAGLCVLRDVAEAYANQVRCDGRRSGLDRLGTALLSGGDIDLALFACQTGGGTGVFPELSLTHLIPSRRLEVSYLVALAEGHAYSYTLLSRIWNFDADSREHWLMRRLRRLRQAASLRGVGRRICRAQWKGTDRARRVTLAAA